MPRPQKPKIPQTHARIYVRDLIKLKTYMKKRGIKSQAEAIRKILRRVGL